MPHGTIEDKTRRAQLTSTVKAYFSGLERADFEIIPFAEDISIRAPLAPGGVHKPIVGKKLVEHVWWTPMKGAIGKIQILDYYFNEDATAVCAEALIAINGTDIVLRVADRFVIDSEGRITEQENHFDPRDLTNPGWATIVKPVA
jgi:hypothetical protein